MFGFLKLPKTPHTVYRLWFYMCHTKGQKTVWGVFLNTNSKAQ